VILTRKSAPAGSRSVLALWAAMILVAGLGVAYLATSHGDQNAQCDGAGSASCALVGTVSADLGVSTKAGAGKNACNGVALTFFADTGAPSVISNVFPVGTRLKITNLDNNKSTTVPVTGVSASCALLNTTAMDQIRQPGKNVIRRNTVERLK
jgi:hypothetical protein